MIVGAAGSQERAKGAVADVFIDEIDIRPGG
jgi:hypothetical protein